MIPGNDFSSLLVRLAFRTKIRSDIARSSKTDPESQHQQNQLIHEIADVLRRNIVQGTKVQEDGGRPLYRKCFFATEDIYV
jgi:ethanolamine utilization cobalamin adenosyltransferase